MKRIVNGLLSAVTLITLSACTTQPNGLSSKPVLKQGASASASASAKTMQYVKLIPAGSQVPFYITVTGNAFKKAVKKNIPLILTHDLYVYDDTNVSETIWASHDRKHWYTLDEAFDGEISFGIHTTPKESSLDFSLQADRKIENTQ